MIPFIAFTCDPPVLFLSYGQVCSTPFRQSLSDILFPPQSASPEVTHVAAFGPQLLCARFDVALADRAHVPLLNVATIVPTLVSKAATAAASGLISFAKGWWGGSTAAQGENALCSVPFKHVVEVVMAFRYRPTRC
jgi:hypothetical protein